MKPVLALAALLASFAGHAAPPDPTRDAQARAALAQAAPGVTFEPDAAAFGDLDGDGVEDFAIVAGDPHGGPDGASAMRLFLFAGARSGGFRLAAKSAPLDDAEVSIRRGSVFLHRDGASGCCAHWAEDFQFSLRGGQPMLIGLETAYAHPDDVQDADHGTSVDLATGVVEHWTGRGGKPARRRRSSVRGLAPVPLAGFDDDAFHRRWRDALW
ncbi:MAG TPA: hypothetical protein VF453_00300 [Burkholderiaceae bacterium]